MGRLDKDAAMLIGDGIKNQKINPDALYFEDRAAKIDVVGKSSDASEAFVVSKVDVEGGTITKVLRMFKDGALTITGTLTAGAISFTGSFLPAADALYDLGSAALRWRDGFFSSSVRVGTSPATAGAVRVANTGAVQSMNQAGNGNVALLSLDTSNVVNLGATGFDTQLATNHGAQKVLLEYDAGNSGTAITIDWNNGDTQKVTMTGNATFTLNNPVKGRYITLKLVEDATGSRVPAWPAAVKWPGGTAPTLSGVSKTDIITFYYDGTNYFGGSQLNY